MGRPTDWQPLADSDPVPGDPAGISSEAAHLSGVAQMIQGQVAQLHKIASGQADERGCYAESSSPRPPARPGSWPGWWAATRRPRRR